MLFDEFNKNNDEIIEDPNITRQRESIAEIAAKSGFKATPTASGEQRKVDYVKDLGMESPEEIAARSGGSDIETALGPEMAALAERKRREMDQFNDALDQCGGEMTQEDLEMITEEPNYEAMLFNPPDPLNKDLKRYTEEQIKRVRETASPEELAAMGLTPVEEKYDTKPIVQEHQDKVESNNVIPIPVVENTEEDEDEEIMNDMDAITVPTQVPELSENIKAALDDTDTTAEVHDDIPIVNDDFTDSGKIAPEEDHVSVKSIDDEDDHFDDDPNKNIVDKIKSVDPSELNNVDLDKEMAELDADEMDTTEQEKVYKEKLKSAGRDIKAKIIPLAAKINITGFSISNKPVSINNSVDMAKADHKTRAARWALFSSNMPVVMSEMSGTEIDELVRLTQGRDFTVTDLMRRYTLFYNHIISPKPADVEKWLKVVSVMDIKHLYGAQYKAAFDGMNFLPYDCTNDRCNNGFITDSVPFDEMVTYEDDEAKKEAMKIYRSEPSQEEYKLYHSEIVPVSNVYAFSFKEPSIWDAQIAPLYLDIDWYNKMEGTIAINTYIDKIYVIDQANKAIRPLAIKEYTGDVKKTLKSKVLALAKVISTLSSDQYNLISAYIEEINKPSTYVDYQLPEVICPKCKTKIEARPTTASNLLFTRHRLTSLANG